MTRQAWTPMSEDWTVDPVELARPASVPPTTWEVSLYRGNRGERDTSMAALFGAMATFASHRFVLTIGNFEHFADWQGWAERQVAGIPGYVGQLFLHWAQRASQHDVFRTGTDAIIRRAWPLPNVTIATSPIATQEEADRVLPALLAVKAARREAVFAPREVIDMEAFLWGAAPDTASRFKNGRLWRSGAGGQMVTARPLNAVHAVRVRGGDAPMHPKWVRLLRDQAKNAGVPFSLAWGEWVAAVPEIDQWDIAETRTLAADGRFYLSEWHLRFRGEETFFRIPSGKFQSRLDGDVHPEEEQT